MNKQNANPLETPIAEQNPSNTDTTYWANRRAKSISLAIIFALALIITSPHPLYIVAIWMFPMGMFYWLENWVNVESTPIIFLILGWFIYYKIARIIIFSENKKNIMVMGVIFILLLILNIHGCRVQDTNYW